MPADSSILPKDSTQSAVICTRIRIIDITLGDRKISGEVKPKQQRRSSP
jgi:hypothetical protein